MVYIIVPTNIQEEIKGTLAKLPESAKGACLWFLETPPPRRNGLFVYDLHCFDLGAKQIAELIMCFDNGESADIVFAKYIKPADVAKVKRFEQGSVFNITMRDTPHVAHFATNEHDFHQQQHCLYEIKIVSLIWSNRRSYTSMPPPDIKVDVGALIPAIRQTIAAGNSEIKVLWLPYTLSRTDLCNPLPLVNKYLVAMKEGSMIFKYMAHNHLIKMLTKIYKSNRRYPFFPTIPKGHAVQQIAKYATSDVGWYKTLQSIFKIDYLSFHNVVLSAPLTVTMLQNKLQECAFRDKIYTPIELVSELFTVGTVHVCTDAMKENGALLISHIYGLGSALLGQHQAYTDYLIWKKRYLAQQAYKANLAYVARELQSSDRDAVITAFKTLVVNDLPALKEMKTHHTALVAEVCCTGGYCDAKGNFERLIVDFPSQRPRFRKVRRARSRPIEGKMATMLLAFCTEVTDE